jgi:hypothetical protein
MATRLDGMVERFNGRLEQVLQTHRFNSAEDLSKTRTYSASPRELLTARHQACFLSGA